ncbi:MAG: alpha/beta fold hydrolase [Rhodoferax sp.]|nr:alpha/beta fold hydrolase [Rhodoferax sp.]
MKIRANGLDIKVEDSAMGGDGRADAAHAKRPVVLLVMGLGMQLIAWPPYFVQPLLDAGYRVIRLDNRDIGLSSHLDHLGKPNLVLATLKLKLGFTPKAPYSLADMAADALGVLDALNIDKAHVVGVSMGGMIAQRIAIAAPQRVLSLTSIMSSSGAKGLPSAKPAVLKVLLGRPTSAAPEAVVTHYLKLFRAIGSPGFPMPEAMMRERILDGVKRSFHPVGTLRQMLAIVSDITRPAQLSRISSPTLVLHGKADPLVPYACGEDTAKRIKGAKLVGIEGMGHDLPPQPVAQMLTELLPYLKAHDEHA